jgi:hypothetical protein
MKTIILKHRPQKDIYDFLSIPLKSETPVSIVSPYAINPLLGRVRRRR